MNKFPIPSNEKQRLKALHDYEILDSLREEDFDRITELASLICEAPISLVSLVDENRQWFKSKVGLEIEQLSGEALFCRYAILDNQLFEVQDASKDERFKETELVKGPAHIRFYAGFPLNDPNGYNLGTLCVLDKKTKNLSQTQRRALELLAQEVIALIVERRKKEELKNFEKLFHLSNDMICVAGTDGFFRKINPAFENVLGWDTSFLLNTSFFNMVHPDDVERTREELQKLSSGANTINFIHRFKTKDHSYKTLQWAASPEPSTGNLFAIARDISKETSKEEQLAISEEKLRAFFENSQGLMCTHDLEGNFLSVNSAGAGMLGYTVDEVDHMSLFDITPPERHPILKSYLVEIKRTGSVKGQMITRHKDGSTRIWMFNNILEKQENGEDYVIGNAIDITERHYLEKDLERTKEMLEQTNKVARVGGWELNVKTKKVYWTDVTREIHQVAPGYEPDLEGGILFYKEGKNREKIQKLVDSAIRYGKSWDAELQIIHAGGKEIWVRAIGNAEFENGECTRLYGTFQDIDEKKKAELELSRSQKLLDDVLQAASEVSIIATDNYGLITVFNTGAERLLGYTAKEMVGKKSPDIIHLREELELRSKELSEEYGYPVQGFRVFIHNPETKGSEQREWTYVKKDGSRLTVSLVITAIRDPKNQVIGYLGIATDISERKKIENALITEKARLSAFVEHAPAAVAMLDSDMKYIAVSNRWLEDYKLKGRQVLGQSHYTIFPDISKEGKERHQRCLTGSVERNDEDLVTVPGQPNQYVAWEIRPWYLFEGQVGGIMIFTQDITSIIKQREELKIAKVQAEQASIAKSEFLANMSHEIRTPLNGVIGFTDLVLKTRLNETQQQYLSIVNQSANALLSIINDILDFSKIEAGKLELEIDKFDLYEMAGQATDIITYQIQTKGLEMLLNVSSDLPRFIWADAVRLKQILINLLGNAAKFTEEGEIELKIEAVSLQDNDKTTIRFGVRDTGIGIHPDKQGKIFEAFSQEDGSTTKKYGGTGLGLTISNKLLGLMGSKLQVKSSPGKGSYFYFDISLKSEQGEPINWANIDMVKKVLIVDDNDNNRIILNQMLLLKQIRSVEAKNGFEALQLLASGEKFDVILMDYHMPYMDGLETIRKIRDSFYTTSDEQPVMLLYSSSDDETVIRACEELEVKHRLVKPIKMQDLYNTLSQLHIASEKAELQVNEIESTREDVIVLIAEDNPVNMLLAKTIIRRIAPNALVWEAHNGLAVIKHCETKMPDLIFMDIQMPEMNGYEATMKIRDMRSGKHVPIIALTAGNVKSEREKCLAAGMDDFVIKPVVEDTLALVFNKWLKGDHEKNTLSSGPGNEKEHFDPHKITDAIGEDPAILKEILELAKVELNESLNNLEKHIENKNLVGINRAGHKLYGTSVTAGLYELSKLANEFEHLGSLNEADIYKLLEKVKAETELVITLMNR